MAILEDASTPAVYTGTGTGTTTTASFTPPAGSLLLALVAAELSGATAPTATITDSRGLTWNFLAADRWSGGSRGGGAWAYWAYSPTSAAMTVSAAFTNLTGGRFLAVRVLTGAWSTPPSGLYVTNGATATSTNTTLTPQYLNSVIYGMSLDFTSSSHTFTPNSGTTVLSTHTNTANGAVCVAFKGTNPVTSLAATNVGGTWSTANPSASFAVEIVVPQVSAAATLGGGGSLTVSSAGVIRTQPAAVGLAGEGVLAASGPRQTFQSATLLTGTGKLRVDLSKVYLTSANYIPPKTIDGFARPHVYLPLVDEAGELRQYAQITVYEADGVTPYTGKLYRDAITSATWLNRFDVAPAVVDFYVEAPTRLVLQVVTDATRPTTRTHVLDVLPDGAQSVRASGQFWIEGVPTPGAMLGADAIEGVWRPIRIDHDHPAVAPGTVLTGPVPLDRAQAGTYRQTTTIGAGAGGLGTPLYNGSALGSGASAARNGTALGAGATTSPAPTPGFGSLSDPDLPVGPGRTINLHKQLLYSEIFDDDELALALSLADGDTGLDPEVVGAVALGTGASAAVDSVALGHDARATTVTSSADAVPVVTASGLALGAGASVGVQGVALGAGSVAGTRGIAIGTGTGAQAHGNPGSIGLGAGAQYGLPSDATDPAVLLGAADPTVVPHFTWANPLGSQSESWLDEYLGQMQFTGKSLQIQRHLQWVIDNLSFVVEGDATIGGRDGTLGFYGHKPVAKGTVGDDEPCSGLPALDSLIYALRDLGLLGYRTEALMLYRAADLQRYYLDEDTPTFWPEHQGRDAALAVGGGFAQFNVGDGDFNDQCGMEFDNSRAGHYTRPLTQYRGQHLLPQAQHFAVVAEHYHGHFGQDEGLFNLSGPDGTADTVFTGGSRHDDDWALPKGSRYYRDGQDQTDNADADFDEGDEPHVYRLTAKSPWPHARPIIGGPRDQAGYADSWSGSINEVVGLDATWTDAKVESMTRGLGFRYNIEQQDWEFRDPAQDFLIRQHNAETDVRVFFDHDEHCYDDRDRDDWDDFTGRITGYVENNPHSVITVPYIEIFEWFIAFEYEGPCSGWWRNCPGDPDDYEVVVVVREISFDDDDDVDIIVGVYDLNRNGTWSSGRDWCRRGHKRVWFRHKYTTEIIAISGTLSLAYDDVEVRVYSERSDGNLRLEDTVSLWGDDTWSARVRGWGRKIARVYQRSTNTLLGTTEHLEDTLPRSTVYAADDPDVAAASVDRAHTRDAALAALAFIEMPRRYWYRTRNILKTLARVANDDGSLVTYYSSIMPTQTPTSEVPADTSGMVWTILAVLRFDAKAYDDRFRDFAASVADFLLTRRNDSGMVLNAAGVANTATNALAYFAFRDLGALLGRDDYMMAAGMIRDCLLMNHWITDPIPRWAEGMSGDMHNDGENLHADALGGLFALAVGDWDKARATIRHLRRYRVKGLTVAASHYTGDDELIGYKPYGELGMSGYDNPPQIIDQQGTWMALLFKDRYGEPVGEDVASLIRWGDTEIIDDPADVLHGAQFLSYSADDAAYGIQARPTVAVAAWAYLMASGAPGFLLPDVAPAPEVTGLAMTSRYDYSAHRVVFDYQFSADPAAVVAAFEAVPEQSTDGGTTWSALTWRAIDGSAEDIRTTPGQNAFAGSWKLGMPDNRATVYRIRVRIRNTTFGTWGISGTVALPTIR